MSGTRTELIRLLGLSCMGSVAIVNAVEDLIEEKIAEKMAEHIKDFHIMGMMIEMMMICHFKGEYNAASRI